MQRSETRAASSLKLDLRPPARLDPWAITLAVAIALATIVPPLAVALIVSGFILAAGALLWKDLVPENWRVMAVLVPLFVVGGAGIAYLHAAAPDPLAELAALEPGEITIEGKVVSPPVQTGFGYRADLRVERLWFEEQEVLRGGGVEIFAVDLAGIGVGDRIRVDGEITPPAPAEDGFDYARYLATKRISAVVDAISVRPVSEEPGLVGKVHRRTDTALGYGLRPQEAAVVRGMVLGDRSLIPEELDEAFRRSGITHVLAISGQHVAILAAMIYFVLRAFAVPMVVRVPVTLGLIWAYILVAGAPPSAIRAGVVATFVLAAALLGRQLSPLHFMTTMLAAVLAYNPQLVYSTGFQLSVAAVFGILLLRKPLQSLVKATVLRPFRTPPETLSNLLSVSLAAQIATAPIIAASFDEVSIIGVLTNLIAVPLSGPILTLGLLASIFGNVAPALAYPLNAVNGFLVTILEWVARGASAMPFAAAKTPGATPLLIWLFYAGCLPAALAEVWFPKERWPLWAAFLLIWTAAWLTLVSFA
ncbi:MAG: ComEC family competence protein [Rubrobacter sp.]|nr:ComEC family competence protein [Rubrobacter sp.]